MPLRACFALLFVATGDSGDGSDGDAGMQSGGGGEQGGGDSAGKAAAAAAQGTERTGFLTAGADVRADGTAQPFAPGALLIASDGVWDNWKYEDVSSALLRPAQVLRVAQATHGGGDGGGGGGGAGATAVAAGWQALHAASPGGGGASPGGGNAAGPLGGLTRQGSRARGGLPRQGANTDQFHAVGSGAALVPGAAPRGGAVDVGGVGCATAMANEFMDKNAELAKTHFGSQADNMTAVALYILPV